MWEQFIEPKCCVVVYNAIKLWKPKFIRRPANMKQQHQKKCM